MKSAIYTGIVSHRRFLPKPHSFKYGVALFYLDLDEVAQIFRIPGLLTLGRGILSFRREDYHGDPKLPLDTSVRNLVELRTGKRPRGPIRVLTQIRYFGFCFNPVTFYYCFDPQDHFLEMIIAEISNTPWNERHAYVLPCVEGDRVKSFAFPKTFHVSPFMPMEMNYNWKFTTPAESLRTDGEFFS